MSDTKYVYVVLMMVQKGREVRSSVMVCRSAESAIDGQKQMQAEHPNAEIWITKAKLND